MTFSIAFDYRFDPTGFYDDPDVRAVLERAAEIWSGLIDDDFETVTAGTTFSVSNPSVSGQRETITLEQDIDDLLIFVGARDISSLGRAGFGGTDAEGDIFRSRISDDFRDAGPVTDFEPWAGVMILDPREDWSLDLDAPVVGKNDLLTTVLHEIGHVLGIGTAPAFDALVVNDSFTGVNAIAANGGTAVPLEDDHSHVEDDHGDDEVLLDPIATTGTRKLPGALDLAILADIGYEIEGYTTQGSTPALATLGNETIFGSLLDDRIEGLAGIDQIQGAAGDDTLLAGAGSDIVFGQGGADSIEGGSGADQLQGNAGDDTLLGGAGSDTIFGQDGDDVLRGGAESDFLLGGAGDDILYAGLGNDSIRVGDGADRIVIEVGMGSDTVYDFEFGRDTLDISALSAQAGNAVSVSGGDTLKHVKLPDGSQIYLQGTLAEVIASVSLGGDAVQNATLTATFTGAVDLFGAPATQAPTFTWLRDGVAIDGATGNTYTLGQADVGAQIMAFAQYSSSGSSTSISTSAIGPVKIADDQPDSAVILAGTDVSGSDLEAVSTGPMGGDGDPLLLIGDANDNRLEGGNLNDTIHGGQGSDTLIGGAGDDVITGGDNQTDLRDVIYGGAGADTIDGSHGNDELRGDAGNDVIAGGFGADTVLGGAGNDTLTGSALGDMLFGGEGDDFINGGFGYDRVNGGDGADKFFHLGVANHGADWIQDYDAGEGDVLVFGNANARASQFQINAAVTTGAGDAAEAFVIYKATGQIMWALVDGMAQDEINLQIGGDVFDLLG